MKIYKQKSEKRKISFFIFKGFLALFLILSFFSLTNVYATDNEAIASDIDTVIIDIIPFNDFNQENLVLEDDLDFENQSKENMSNTTINSNTTFNMNKSTAPNNMDTANSFSPEPCLGDNEPTNDNKSVSYRDSIEKIEGKSTISQGIVSNGFNPIISYYDPNSEGRNNDNNDIVDDVYQDLILPISSLNFKGNGFDNFNNFIKKVANINYNKIDNDEDISIIQDFQSSSYSTLTILFFIKIFMDFHNNGKEHLTSF